MRTRLALIALAIACGGPARVPPPPPPVHPAPEPVTAGPDAAVVSEGDDDEVADDGPAEIVCDDGVNDPASFPPVLAADAPERAWDIAIREHVLAEDCEHQWSVDLKQCLATGTPAGCATHLPPDLSERLDLIDKLSAAVAAARKKPASIGCKQVVAVHYSDAQWQGRLEGFSRSERAQMIADSRKLMLAACTSERWDEITRACLTLRGGEVCLLDSDPPIRRMWGFPADGSVHVVGVPPCDTYAALVSKLASCKKVASFTRDSLTRMTAAMMANIAAKPVAERAKAAAGCEAGLGAIEATLRRAGC